MILWFAFAPDVNCHEMFYKSLSHPNLRQVSCSTFVMPNQLKNLNQPQPENQLQTMPTEESPVLGEVWDEAVNQSPKTTHTQAIWAWLKDKKTLVAAGIGFMADSYDLFVIANVMLIMSKKYALNDAYKAFITSAALAGAVFGQLFFGTLCDWFGRKAIS
jgi:hypothetical protein